MIVGLGCSRFGSLVVGAEHHQAVALVQCALDMGIVEFDTADIYGQGDSERVLGEALWGRDARVTTKVGQVFPFAKRVMIPLKRIAKPILARSGSLIRAVSAARAEPLPRDLSARHLTHGVDASLKRLRREYVDVLLLHSPPVEALLEGGAMETLSSLKRAGKAVAIGASVDCADGFAAAADDPNVQVIQFPSSAATPMPATLLVAASTKGIRLVAREVLGGATSPNNIEAALKFAADQPVDVTLIGTRSARHLAHAAERLERC